MRISFPDCRRPIIRVPVQNQNAKLFLFSKKRHITIHQLHPGKRKHSSPSEYLRKDCGDQMTEVGFQFLRNHDWNVERALDSVSCQISFRSANLSLSDRIRVKVIVTNEGEGPVGIV